MTEEKILEYTLFTPFGGIGGGAFGFLQAESHLFGVRAKFRLIGGIDFDRESCDDFEYLCGVPQACLDVSTLTVEKLRELVGGRRPDVLILSPPCKGSSKLIGAKLASSPKYVAMNRLAEVWTELMLGAWGDDLPRLIIFENVPNITTRAAAMLRRIRNLLTKAGYAIQDGYHECGAVGGLAQRRRRWFMVARLKASVPRFLYQAPAKRIRGCGEVLKMLPLPGDPASGPMHVLPAISIINQIRLALIPPGGDWRDLPGILAEGQARRTLFRRRHLEAWTDPSITVAGPGSNGPYAVADPRPSDLVPIKCEPRRGAYGVTGWATASGTVTGAACFDNGRFAVADPRPALGLPFAYANVDRVYGWTEPVGTITHAPAPSSGAPAVADPRPAAIASGGAFSNSNRVTHWSSPVPTIVSKGSPASGGPAVADPRIADLLVGFAYPHAYAVLGWSQPSFTIHGQSMPGCGAYSVADPRVYTGHGDALGVLVWDEAARTITGRATVTTGAFAVASPVIPQPGNEDMHWGKYVVVSWEDPVRTIAGASRVGSGAQSVADPRASGFKGVYGVTAWGAPSTTVTANARACTGSFSVADPRFPGSMGVTEWTEPAPTVAGESYPSNGAFAVADPRADALPRGVIALDDIMDVLDHPQGSVFAIIDPRRPHEPVAFIDDIKRPAYRLELIGSSSRSKSGRPAKPRYKRVSVPLVILSEDTPGVFSWHRALTTAELAALQGFPIMHNGAPFRLVGGSTGQRERIGNAIPPPTAKAIGEQMLLCLLSADTGMITMGTGVVWVSPDKPWIIGDVVETAGLQ